MKTPISSPPFDSVVAITERNDIFAFFLFCISVSGFSLDSKSFFMPMATGVIPINPRTNVYTANVINAANEEIMTSITIPRNCPTITLGAKSSGVTNNKIRINVSLILEATKAAIPIPKIVIKSVKSETFVR